MVSRDRIATEKLLQRQSLEELYGKLNKREYVHPDPLEFLFSYDSAGDREIVGLIASSLAYGRVAGILRSVSWVLRKMPSPFETVIESSKTTMDRLFHGFKHRFSTGEEMSSLLLQAGRIITEYGSLQGCFLAGYSSEDETILPALLFLSENLNPGSTHNSLLPRPHLGSACKRINLFLRWMVREDDVDPGGWNAVSPSKLIIPLDTHMHSIGLGLGFTARKSADMKTALEITKAFREFSPADPSKYDFALTRLGIRDDTDKNQFISDWHRVGPIR